MKTNTNFLRTALASAFLFVGMIAFAQVHVTGVIIDAANGETIIGANVVEVGTSNGTITDFDGNFELDVQSGAQLEFSYMGYKTQILPASATMKVKLGEDTEQLDEVVVVGYGVVKKNDATGSVTAIKPDEMNKGLNTSMQDMLSGKIAGVNLTSSGGTPGSAPTIRIRGGSSLSASNDPLIIIDGLAMDNDGVKGASNGFAMVNPNDIESMTVLKDASATAIYGSRASNGVIIITTKKGATGSKPKFQYDGNVSIGTLTNRMQVMTGDQLRMYATALGHNAAQLSKIGTANTNWQDYIFQVAPGTDHNFSITGGTKHMPYRFSLGYTYQDGTIKTSNMQRVTAAVSLSPTFLDKHLSFNLNAKGMYSYNRYSADVVGSALAIDPTHDVYFNEASAAQAGLGTATLTALEQANRTYGGYWQGGIGSAEYFDPEWTTSSTNTTGNPLAQLMGKNDRAHSGSFVGNLEADYKIHGFEDLRLHANFGANYSYGKQWTSIQPWIPDSYYFGKESWSDQSKYNILFTAYIQYYKDFNENHHFDIMAGYDWQHFRRDEQSYSDGFYRPTTTLVDENGVSLAGKPYANWHSETSFKTENYLVSFYGRANYIALNRYMITATVRGDGSSRFAKDHRWGVFPSVALGWKIKEEPWMQEAHWISELKLRAGYGITGQQDIKQGDYPFLATYVDNQGNTHAYYPAVNGTPTGTIRPNAYNEKLTWEKTTTYNVGLDYGFLKGRITGAFDYYYRITNDLINNETYIAVGTNFSNKVVSNIGSLTNQGVEFSVNAVAIDRKHFRWDIGYNVGWNQNRITKLNTGAYDSIPVPTGEGIAYGTGNNVQVHKINEAAYSFYVYETYRDANGVYQFRDRNGDSKIDEGDKYIYHKSSPDVTMGLNMKFQFYNFDIGFNLRASIGNYVYNSVLMSNAINNVTSITDLSGTYRNVMINSFNLWYNDGFTNNNPASNITSATYPWSDRFVENASFLRCDNITLGYSFTKNPSVKARIYATVQNPFVISGYSGLDPEIFSGVDNNIYPRCLTTIVGASVSF